MNAPDVRERGAPVEGEPQFLNSRLYILVQAFSGCRDSAALAKELDKSGIEGALYEDLHDPAGVAVLSMSEDPAFFAGPLRAILGRGPFAGLEPKPGFSFLGRTYASGFEPDLKDWLLQKPRRTILDQNSPWAIWYPLRRTGEFNRLSPEEQGRILKEHGAIGRAYGEAGLAHDVRLACFGLDKDDNDFVIGLVGKELHPLSMVVQAMRRTQQTAQYMDRMGPFFVGRAVWRTKLKA